MQPGQSVATHLAHGQPSELTRIHDGGLALDTEPLQGQQSVFDPIPLQVSEIDNMRTSVNSNGGNSDANWIGGGINTR